MHLELNGTSVDSMAERRGAMTPSLPARLKILYITTAERTGARLAETFAADSATRLAIFEAQGPAAGLEQLGQEAFDAVLIVHWPGKLDALSLVDGLRAGGMEEPIVILGVDDSDAMSPLAFEVGADAYVCESTATTRGLLWLVARAIERFQLVKENRRFAQSQRQRAEQEYDEARRLLDQQRDLLRETEQAASSWSWNMPESLSGRYQQLLRTHVIMGSGNLAAEIDEFVKLLLSQDAHPSAVLALHTSATEQQIRGLGAKGARHILARADLLILDVLARLSAGYRSQYLESAKARD